MMGLLELLERSVIISSTSPGYLAQRGYVSPRGAWSDRVRPMRYGTSSFGSMIYVLRCLKTAYQNYLLVLSKSCPAVREVRNT